MAEASPKLKQCLEALERHGLLLLQDAKLPSVTTIVAGAPVRGSWWAHAHGHGIFDTAQALEESKDIAVAKLVGGKVTYIHRRLWPALLAVGTSREAWQTRGLPPRAKALLAAVEKAGSIRTDLAAAISRAAPKEIAKAALELERRLLVFAVEVHTESGAHAKELEMWSSWAQRHGLEGEVLPACAGRAELERALEGLNAVSGARAKLPWQ